MRAAITGTSMLSSKDAERALAGIISRIRPLRLVTDLEQLAVAALAGALDDAGIAFPAGTADIGIYLGIDDAVEDIKDIYFNGILNEGLVGASPLLFPYTTPNALTAQLSIAFDMRGESITMPLTHSAVDVLQYSAECVAQGHAVMAVTGVIAVRDKALSSEMGRYTAEFFIVEDAGSAASRGAKIYRWLEA
jgi:3-oxoacyl-(acyl-carrier-protein) synthase